MLVVTGVVEIEPGGVEAAKAAAIRMVAATRTEDGCLEYAFWQSLEQPNLFRVYEEWESRAALQAHGQTPHMAEWRAELGKIGVLSRDIVSFDRGEATPL